MQQIEQLSVHERIPNLLPRRRVPYPDEIIDGLNRINDTLAECIAMSERVLNRSGNTFPHGLKNAAADYSGRLPHREAQIQSENPPEPTQISDFCAVQV